MEVKSIEIVTVYEAYATDYDGRHAGTMGIYSTKSKADIAKGNGPFTSVGNKKAVKITFEDMKTPTKYFVLDRSFQKEIDIDRNLAKKKAELAQKALSKLSVEERVALGLGK